MHDIGIVMVSMGRLTLLRNTLSTLCHSGFDGPMVVVEQGAREANTRPYLESIGMNTVLLKENHGKGYAWNLGMSILREPCEIRNVAPPGYVLLCDDDLIFKSDWAASMVATLEAFYPSGLRALSGFRHSSQAHAKGFSSGYYQIVEGGVPPFVPGCCLLMRFADVMSYGYPFVTDKFIGDIEGDVMRKLYAAGYSCASMCDSVIDHAGARQRSWHPGTKLPRAKMINKPE